MTQEERRKLFMEKLKDMTLMHDEFMSAAFADNIPAVELVISLILQRSDLVVKDVTVQRTIENLKGHSVRLDVLAVDNNGKWYNIEIQRASKGAGAKRARYNSSLIDAELLEKNHDYSDLPETYVIFITERDFFNAGKQLYHVERRIQETATSFGDGTHIIYVNGEYIDETPLGRLISDFHATDAGKMHYDILSERVYDLKETEGGQYAMSEFMEEIAKAERAEGKAEGIAEGEAKGRTENALQTALNMLKKQMSLNDIADCTGLPIEKVQELALQV